MLNVVIDTSVLISFVLTSGDITRQLIDAWRANEFVVLTTPQIRAELRQVLASPRILERTLIPLDHLADDIDRFSRHVPGELILAGACRDPKDDKFLACAVEGEAHYLVSSDRDLLDIGRFQGICILNPGQFLVAAKLARLSSAEIRARYSRDILAEVAKTLCLEPATLAKVRDAIVVEE